MSSLLNRFSGQSARWNGTVILALCLVWLAVLACIISSILTQPFSRPQRIFWIAVVIFLPAIGALAYLPFALRKEDFPPIFHRMAKQPRRHKDTPSSSKP